MYTKVKIGLVPESGEIYYCVTSVKPFWSNMHPDEQIVQLLKISISNVTGVSFGLQKTIFYKISKDVTNNQILETLNQPQMTELPSIFVHIHI